MSSGEPAVLIVEDEKPLAELFEMWLAESCDVQVATSGRDALEALHHELDVVVLDWRMPQVPGEKILERIHEKGMTTAVLVVTGFEPEFDEIDYQVDASLIKPVTSNELRSVVTNLAAKHAIE